MVENVLQATLRGLARLAIYRSTQQASQLSAQMHVAMRGHPMPLRYWVPGSTQLSVHGGPITSPEARSPIQMSARPTASKYLSKAFQ